MRKKLDFILIAGSLALLGGCSSFFALDESEFACAQAAKGMPCVSVRAALLASDNYDPDAQIVMADSTRKKRWFGKKKTVSNEVSPFDGGLIPDMVAADEPKPLLMPAQVMSVWVNNYEDADGNLVYPTRIYSEIQTRKWDTGYRLSATDKKNSRRVTPLVSNQQSTQDIAEQATQPQTSQTETVGQSSNQSIPNSLPAGILPPLK